MKPRGTLLIVGLGLIGGSIGLEARRLRLFGRVVGYARRPETAREALLRGAVDEVTFDLPSALRSADLAVFCTPVLATLGFFGDRRLFAGCRAAVTDACSTKALVVRRALSNPALKKLFVGAHPMAGSEKSGVRAAVSGLFRGAVCVLMPSPSADARCVRAVRRFWTALGCRLLSMTPAVHDAAVSRTSHLPHLLSNAFLSLFSGPSASASAVAGPSFRDFTRIGGTAPRLWAEIFSTNSAALARALDALNAELSLYRAALRSGRVGRLEKLLQRAAGLKDKLFEKTPENP